jgi:hypothetical protein
MKLQCPSCQKVLTVSDQLAGKRGKCPGCGAVFQVGAAPVKPGPTLPDAPAAAPRLCPGCNSELAAEAVVCNQCGYDCRPGVPAPQRASGKKRKKKGNTPLWIGAGAAAGAVVLVLLVVALWPSRKPAATPAGAGAQAVPPAAPGTAPSPSGAAPAAATPRAVSLAGGDGTQPTALPPMMWDVRDADLKVPAWVGQQKDEPFDVKQFLESRAAPPDNAAPLYFAALADVSGEMYAGPNAPSWWPWRFPVPSEVRTLGGNIYNLANDPDKLRAGTFPLVEVERVLAMAQPTVQKLDWAQQKPRCVFISRDLAGYASASRTFAQLAVIQLYHARLKGDFDEAEQAIRRTLRAARDLRPRGFLVSQLMSFAMEGVVFSAVRDFTLGQSGMDPKRCDRLLAILAEHQRDPVSPSEEGLRIDYIFGRNTFDDLQHGRRQFADVFGGPPNPNQLEQLKHVNWQTEIAAFNRVYAAELATAKRPLHEVLASKRMAAEVAKAKADGAVLAGLVMPAHDAFFGAEARHRAGLAGSQCLIAVRRYALAHQSLPPDLKTATQEAGLDAVPIDPFCGEPMHYKVINGKPVVYSVGFDRKDDGGTVDSHGTPIPGDILYQIGD